MQPVERLKPLLSTYAHLCKSDYYGRLMYRNNLFEFTLIRQGLHRRLDMRYWGKNIEIDGSFYKTEMGKKLLPTDLEMNQLRNSGNFFQLEGGVEIYEVIVQNTLREIEKNQVGSILLNAINSSSKKLRIIPLTGKEQFTGNPKTRRVPCNNPVGVYNTSGNDTVIWFEPWSRMINLSGSLDNTYYDVMVHELQHALRTLRGKWYQAGTTGAFPNAEELFSVMIQNIFMSAAGQPQRMLGAYDENVRLNNRTDRDFYKQYGNDIEIWCHELPDLTIQIERIYGLWNPIRVRRNVLDFVIQL